MSEDSRRELARGFCSGRTVRRFCGDERPTASRADAKWSEGECPVALESRIWARPLRVIVVAVAATLALVAFQYYVVFLGLVGYHPDVRDPVTASEKVACFRAVVFIGRRQACAEGFTAQSSLPAAAAVNFVACVVAAAVPVLVAGGRRWREATEARTIGLSAAVLAALPIVLWAFVSTFGILIASALSD